MKKILSITLAAVMALLIFLPGAAYARQPYTVENPLYSGAQKMLGSSLKSSPADASVSKTYKKKTYSTAGAQLYRAVKGSLEDRKSDFDIYVLSKSKITSEVQATNGILQDVFYGSTSDEIADTCTDGDYLRWAISAWGANSVTYVTNKDGYNYYVINTHYNYYDSASQEQQVDDAINSFVSSYSTSGKSDAQIIKDVHDFICNRTTYDNAADLDPMSHLYAFSPYGVFFKGKSVCQGYASAFYRICKELGYSVRFVSSDANEGCHAWNIVRLDGKYYTVDCTWDDEARDGAYGLGFGNDAFLLVSYDSSRKYDSSLREHTLYQAFYNTRSGYFYDNYFSKYSSTDYYPDNEARLSDCNVSLSETSRTYGGGAFTPSVTVTDGNYTLKENTDYTVSYSENILPGSGTVNITGAGSYGGTSTSRRFEIYPAAAESLSVASVSSGSIKLKWNASPGASGYDVQRYTNGEWQTLLICASPSCTVSDLSSATKYNIRVRAYKMVSKRSLYSGGSGSVSKYTKPAKASLKKLKAQKKSFKVQWKKTNGSGYQIQYSLKKNMKKAKTVKVSGKGKTSKTIKKLKKKKKYYVRIRAYKKYKENGKTKTDYGKWSKKKTVKTK